MPDKSTVDIVIVLTYSFHLLWIGLLKAATPSLSNFALGGLVLGAQLVQLLVPKYLASTYVQTIIFLVFSMNQLVRNKKEKDYSYTTHPWIVGMPLTLVGWMEGTQCTAFVKDRLYGHLVYDAWIPLDRIV